MDRIALSDVDVFRLECEGCNANEIAAAMQIPVTCSVALMHRARILFARAQDERFPAPLALQKRAS